VVAAFLANVGVNCSHRVRSPLHEDGSFELRPIPERVSWAPPMLKLPEIWGDKAVHLDPDLTSAVPTYGDNCRRAARAYSLRSAQQRDEIRFLARLTRKDRSAGFYEVAKLVIEEVLEDVTEDPGPGWWDGNAHVRRARATGVWDAFWVFRGGPGSGLYSYARPFTRRQADAAFGHSWLWRSNRTDLQTIGSYTRTVRRLP
jgi:Nucleotide modification associated domain 3